jgi:hypothetical protein
LPSATAVAARPEESQPAPTPRFFDTYGVSYALGLLFLLPAIFLIGTQPLYSFNALYTTVLAIPPVAASFCLLATDPPGAGRRHLVPRGALLTVLATIGSVLALVAGTPVVILLFREGVGHSQATTALISSAGLAFVSAPMLWSLVRHVRAGAWVRVGVLVLAVAAMGTVIALTLSPGGILVDSMRRDQGEIMMGLLEWCLPAFAVTTAFLRSSGLV